MLYDIVTGPTKITVALIATGIVLAIAGIGILVFLLLKRKKASN